MTGFNFTDLLPRPLPHAAVVFAALTLLPMGCAEPGDDEDLMATQTIDSHVDTPTFDRLVAAADLGDALEVADFHVYTATPPTAADLPPTKPDEPDLDSSMCERLRPDPVESRCGYCSCDEFGEIVCIDYGCDPTALTFDPPTPGDADQRHDELTAARSCEGGYLAGESWYEDCNVCTCKGDGTITCTMMVCEPAPR